MLLHVMPDVTVNDRGLYSCNLHHLYCNLYEMVRVQLNVTKSRTYDTKCRLPLRIQSVKSQQSQVCPLWNDFFYEGRKEQRFWDGQKAVYVVLVGSTVVLPCINRRNVWTDWTDEEEDQQVCTVHGCNSSVGSRPPNWGN